MSKKRISKFDSFSNKSLTNKFDFIVGKKYIFDDLPNEIKDDIQIQFVEGNHRALAFWYLKKDLPYLEMLEINE